MPAAKKNKYASKHEEEIISLIESYITHRAGGFSKKSFPDCDYETIERHLDNDEVCRPYKELIYKAEREGLKVWEEIGIKMSKGDIRGNAATWIFTMKNKYPEDWKDKSEISHDIGSADADKQLIEEIDKIKLIIKSESQAKQ